MEITYHNGKKIETNDYITVEKDNIEAVLLDGRNIAVECLPRLLTPEYVDLRYLNYGARTFVIYKNTKEKIQRFYTYEQKIVHNKMEVVDYMATTIIPYDHPLKFLINNTEYNKEYDIQTMCELTDNLTRIEYMINPYSIYGQIINFVFPVTKDTEVTEKPLTEVAKETEEKKTLAQMARDAGLSYKTLWSRVHVRGIPLERALQKDKPREKVNKKNKYPDVTFEGKNLRELAKEYGIRYNKLWDRVHRQGRTIEEALAMGNTKRK